MFNFIYIYSFIPMGARDAVKTALLLLLLSKKQ
jgi:hypothetical protein